MKFIFLSTLFYRDYAACVEIETKQERPYTQVYTEINGVQFAIPLRSNISHKEHVLWTDKKNGCGLDFSKAVVVVDEKYIDTSRKPFIRPNEFDSLRGKEYIVMQKMIKHIQQYKRAKQNQEIDRNKILCKFSTMQYFEDYISEIGGDSKQSVSSQGNDTK
jgi:protein AbiQ